MKKKLVIHAVKVAWKLESVSDPEIIEKSDANVKIRLLAYFGEKQYEIDFKEQIALFNNECHIPDEVANNMGCRLIYITFFDVDHCELINPDPFTQNKILFNFPIIYADELLENYDAELFERESKLKIEIENICIDSDFYEITNSPFACNASPGLIRRHWIVVGHDELLSITATRFEIEILPLRETCGEMRE